MFGIDLGPHDDTPWGWMIVGVYLVAAALSVAAGIARRRKLDEPARLEWFWYLFAVAMIALAINKQLDLQTELHRYGVRLAWDQGWYGGRRVVQAWFVRGVAATSIAIAVALLFAYRRGSLQHWLAIGGFTLLLGFIVVRAASLHNIDALLFARSIADLNGSRALELGGALVLAAAALWAALAPAPPFSLGGEEPPPRLRLGDER